MLFWVHNLRLDLGGMRPARHWKSPTNGTPNSLQVAVIKDFSPGLQIRPRRFDSGFGHQTNQGLACDSRAGPLFFHRKKTDRSAILFFTPSLPSCQNGRHSPAQTQSPALGRARGLSHLISRQVIRCCALERTLCRSLQQSA